MNRQEEIINAGIEYTMQTRPMCIGGDNYSEAMREFNRNRSFEEGAKWADKTMIDKVCEYLEEELYEVVSGVSNAPDVMSIENTTMEDFIKNFRKAMEE